MIFVVDFVTSHADLTGGDVSATTLGARVFLLQHLYERSVTLCFLFSGEVSDAVKIFCMEETAWDNPRAVAGFGLLN